jgi:GTP pyrophosphokinase
VAFDVRTPEDLYVAIGHGMYTVADALRTVDPGAPIAPDKVNGSGRGNGADGHDANAVEPSPISIRGLIPGMAVHYSNCCHPLPGDNIMGIMTPGKGVAIHTADCETLESFRDSPERWVDVAWDLGPEGNHVGRLKLLVVNERGALGRLSTVIANNEGNIVNLKMTNRSADFFEMVIDVEVKGARHLTEIIAALRATNAVNTVERVQG